MQNRFFDIDNNIFFNGLYLLSLICNERKVYKLEEINLKLFLIKNPYIMLNVYEKLGISLSKDIFKEFQYFNLQADMSRYLLKVQVKGLLEALNFLYSKGLIEVNYQKKSMEPTLKCMQIDKNDIPDEIMLVSNRINELFETVIIKDIKKALFIEGDSLYE